MSKGSSATKKEKKEKTVLSKSSTKTSDKPESAIQKRCTAPSCRKELDGGKMACPTCVKKSLPTSFFCSQKCFTENWSEHKAVHSTKPSSTSSSTTITKSSKKRSTPSANLTINSVFSPTGTITQDAFRTAFCNSDSPRILHIQKSSSAKKSKSKPPPPASFLPHLSSLWDEDISESSDAKSWTIENELKNKDSESSKGGEGSFLSLPSSNARGYCSFILQKNKGAIKKMFAIESMPCEGVLPLESGVKGGVTINQTDAVWVFIARNSSASIDKVKATDRVIQGRVEHTDSVTHDATWHSQVQGSKIWHVRPTDDLLLACPDLKPIEIHCGEGDVLVIDTKAWWHCTSTPEQDVAISYARDIYINRNEEKQAGGPVLCGMACFGDVADDDINESISSDDGGMSNVDGMYASRNLDTGDIVFTEADFPDGELHRSDKPNCEVVEIEDGEMAVVTLRPVRSGEFFSIAESDDDEEEEREDFDYDYFEEENGGEDDENENDGMDVE